MQGNSNNQVCCTICNNDPDSHTKQANNTMYVSVKLKKASLASKTKEIKLDVKSNV